MQPITGHTRQVMAAGNVHYAIPGLRQAMVALRNVGWWSDVTRDLRPGTTPATGPAGLAVPAARARRGQWPETAAPAGCSPTPGCPWCRPSW